MGVMMMTVMATDCLSHILHIGKLAALGGAGEVRRKLVELVCRCRIAASLGSLSYTLQVRGDLLGGLLIVGWIRLLKVLERAHQANERWKLAVVRRRGDAPYVVTGAGLSSRWLGRPC